MLIKLDFLREFGILAIIVKILLSMVCGGILGLERGKKRRAAGMRTYMLVCIGATLVMLTSQYISFYYGLSDPQRLGAQVISGIGFLGAGTIIVTGRNQVKGLTTAAGLWAAACMGLAIGIGFYEGALIGCLVMYLALTLFQRIDNKLFVYSKVIELFIEFSSQEYIGGFVRFLRSRDIGLVDLELIKTSMPSDGNISVRMTIDLPSSRYHGEMLSILGECEGVNFIEEIL